MPEEKFPVQAEGTVTFWARARERSGISGVRDTILMSRLVFGDEGSRRDRCVFLCDDSLFLIEVERGMEVGGVAEKWNDQVQINNTLAPMISMMLVPLVRSRLRQTAP